MDTRILVHVMLLIIASIAAVRAQAGSQVSTVEIGRGVCGSPMFSPFIIVCNIVSATPSMTLQVNVIRQISNVRCVYGINFGIAVGNSYIWTSGGCQAEFSVLSVVPVTTNRPSTSTSTTPRLTTVTTTQTTVATAPVNNPANCGEVGGGLGIRIIGGSEASDCQFPWVVLVYNQFTQTICGGSIISNTHILTAAHCFVPSEGRKVRANELIVYSGSASLARLNAVKRKYVLEIITHENYNNQTLEYDIAVLKLREPIVFDACHKPLCLVDGSKSPQQATDCRAMGWGLKSNTETEGVTQMRYVDLPIASDDACRGVYGSLSSGNTFCAGGNGKDSCQGDSGGPFVCKEADSKYYLYGVVSAGIQKSCGNLLGIYTRVSAFLSWITAHTK